ncbi:MAG: CHAT domain-containing protein [Verrucomicrobiales bacterium]|nr:CHAT domain-containing protein [Verrucomicrobiales bacterium]
MQPKVGGAGELPSQRLSLPWLDPKEVHPTFMLSPGSAVYVLMRGIDKLPEPQYQSYECLLPGFAEMDLDCENCPPTLKIQGWPHRDWDRWNWLWEQGLPYELGCTLKNNYGAGFCIPIEAERDPALISEVILSTRGLFSWRESHLYAARLTKRNAASLQGVGQSRNRTLSAIQNYIHKLIAEVAAAGTLQPFLEKAVDETVAKAYLEEQRSRRELIQLLRPPRPPFLNASTIQARLPSQTVLISYVRYSSLQFGDRRSEEYGAVLLLAGGEPRWVRLGSALKIESLVSQYHVLVRQSQDEPPQPKRIALLDHLVGQVLRQLSDALWKPIATYLPAETKHAIILPDGATHFISFASLMGESGRFLSEEHDLQFRYQENAWSLLQPAARPPRGRRMEVFADPDFDQSMIPIQRKPESGLRAYGQLLERSLLAGSLGRLEGTRREAMDCVRLQRRFRWLQVKTHLDRDATEGALRACQKPFILHVGTHGLFLHNAASPLLRSGLALSGANSTLGFWRSGQTPDAEKDGVLFAAELALLDLSDTWLVVLSACESALGSPADTEGMFGLCSAFAQAGARHVLSTLWTIDDRLAPDFFQEFYSAALSTTNAPLALHSVQRRWLTDTKREPSLWLRVKMAAPFVMYSR